MRQYIVVDEAELMSPRFHGDSGFYVYEVDSSAVLVETANDSDMLIQRIVDVAHEEDKEVFADEFSVRDLFPLASDTTSTLSEEQVDEITAKYTAQIATAWPGTVQNILRNMLIEVAGRTS